MIRDAALAVPHPIDPTKTLWDARHDTGPFDGDVDEEVMDLFVQEREDLVLGDLELPALGSGSDFTPFLQHLGVCISIAQVGMEVHVD